MSSSERIADNETEASSIGPSVSPVDAPTTDVRALVNLVAELERCQQQEDVEGFLSLFDSAAVWVNGAGRRLIGRDTIAAFTRQVLPGAFANGSVNYSVVHVAFLGPDIALTGVDQQYTDLEGRPSGGAGSPSYVWSRSRDTWRIVAGQNTAVWSAED
jgi:uncharacterized protein (TIGR02246 family)